MTPKDSSNQSDTDSQDGQGHGRPNWAIGLALLGLILVLLGGAFILNGRLKPAVGTEPVVATAIGAVATRIPSAVPNSATASAGVAIPTATNSPNAGNKAITQAYLRYWDVYSSALETLDTSHLSEVMTDDELKRAQAYVEQLRAEGHGLKTDVSHHYEVTSMTAETATLDDQLVNRSYLIDPATKQPVGSPEPATPETIACRLQLKGGVWKVTSVIKVAVTVVNQ